MIKRILAAAAAAGVAATLVVSGSATAAPCNTSSGPNNQTPASNKGETVVVAPGTGTRVYKTPGQPSTGGYIGVQGGSGWIEANGSAGGNTGPTGGYIAGKANAGPVDGRISGTMNPDNLKVCAAEQQLK